MLGTAQHYARYLLCDPERREANAEAIAGALGFCPAHAAFLRGLEGSGAEIGAVMRRAAVAVRALLEPGPGHEDRLVEILFGAARACPACRYAERRLGSLLARHAATLRSLTRGPERTPPPLCLPHFRALLAASEQSDLRHWIAVEIDVLSAVSAPVDAPWIVVGRPDVPPASAPAGAVAGCAICAAGRGARERWLESAKESVRLDAGEGAVLPGCPDHLLTCIQSGDARLAARAVQHARDAALRTLWRAVSRVDEEDRRVALEARSVFYRPKSPAFVLGQRRKALRPLWRCAPCERTAAARERAVGQLLAYLGDQGHRDAFGREQGLCLKHFAEVRLIAPSGAMRDTLTAVQSAKLRTLERGLAAAGSPAWKEAICRFSGTV